MLNAFQEFWRLKRQLKYEHFETLSTRYQMLEIGTVINALVPIMIGFLVLVSFCGCLIIALIYLNFICNVPLGVPTTQVLVNVSFFFKNI